jgi:flagellar biosynthesis protein
MGFIKFFYFSQVVKHPRPHPSLAVALRYEPGKEQAPQVVASGHGRFAERMVERATESHVPVHKDDHLANLLSKLPVPSSIPEELFEAVARVLAFIFRVNGRLASGRLSR